MSNLRGEVMTTLEATAYSVPHSNERVRFVSNLAEQLINEARDRIFRRTDRLLGTLMLGQWLFAIVLAAVVSPQAWAGRQTSVHVHVYAAIVLGGLINTLPFFLSLTRQ